MNEWCIFNKSIKSQMFWFYGQKSVNLSFNLQSKEVEIRTKYDFLHNNSYLST